MSTSVNDGNLKARLLGAAASAALILALVPGSAAAQMTGADRPPVEIDIRGGFYVPTFDIADVADPGPGFGAGIGIPVGERLTVRGNADFGFHSGAELNGVEGPDVNVFHYIAGIGVVAYRSPDRSFELSFNAGGGAMTFDVDGVEDSFTYPAINVGATLAYRVAPAVSLLLSPQGDIAFSDELDPVRTSNSWVWPFTAGIRITPGM